jgi:hypothetical protein
MPDKKKQGKKGFFAKLCELFNGVEGSGCTCNCLKTVWEKQAREEANKALQEKSESQEH